jgi:hypothetical protein
VSICATTTKVRDVIQNIPPSSNLPPRARNIAGIGIHMVHLFNQLGSHMLKPSPGLRCTCLHMKANRVTNLTVLVPHHLHTMPWMLPERDELITEQHRCDNKSSPTSVSVLQRRHVLPLPNVSMTNASPRNSLISTSMVVVSILCNSLASPSTCALA